MDIASMHPFSFSVLSQCILMTWPIILKHIWPSALRLHRISASSMLSVPCSLLRNASNRYIVKPYHLTYIRFQSWSSLATFRYPANSRLLACLRIISHLLSEYSDVGGWLPIASSSERYEA